MTTFLTIGHPHKGDAPVILVGPEKRFGVHQDEMKKLPAGEAHEKFKLVQMWSSSSGVVKSRRFVTPAAFAEMQAEQKRRIAEAHRKAAEAAEASANAKCEKLPEDEETEVEESGEAKKIRKK